MAQITQEFGDYTPLFGVAMEIWRSGQTDRAQYGNMILSRYPVSSVFNHPLPQPADGSKKQMPRQLTEATVQAPSGPLRVMTTHLEFHSQVQRLAQSKRIMAIEQDIQLLEKMPPMFTDGGPYARFERSARSVLCGDFNFLAHSQEYEVLTGPAAALPKLHDAWCIANPGQAYVPSCGIFDDQQWPEGPHCRDFMFVSNHLTEKIQSMFVDTQSAASDHQPLVLKLDV